MKNDWTTRNVGDATVRKAAKLLRKTPMSALALAAMLGVSCGAARLAASRAGAVPVGKIPHPGRPGRRAIILGFKVAS